MSAEYSDATARQDDTPPLDSGAPSVVTDDATRDTTAGEIVTISEAAKRLGVSVRTVQRRLDSGELNSIEEEGKRKVLFPASVPPDATAPRDNATSDTTPSATRDAPRVEPDAFKATPDDATIELIEQLRGERDRLIEQLEDTRAERDRWQNFAGVMLERMKALPQPVAPADAPIDAQAAPSTPVEEIPAKSTPTPPRAAQMRKVKPWQRAIMRIIGARE